MKTVVLDNLYYAYPGPESASWTLAGTSLEVDQGEVLALLGRNGAGKSTLIRVAIGLLRARHGSVRLFGQDPREYPVEVKRRIGYVAEDQVLPTSLRVEELFALHRTLFPTWDPELERSLCSKLALPRGRRLDSLSKGQARVAAMICAVAHRPEVLILDEPSGGLDPAARREFLEITIQLLAEEGSTILLSSHHTQEVERIAGRVAFLHEGTILLDEELDRLREGTCLAILQTDRPAESRPEEIEGCLNVRAKGDRLHLLFATPPELAQARLRDELGIEVPLCRPLALDELFLELTARAA